MKPQIGVSRAVFPAGYAGPGVVLRGLMWLARRSRPLRAAAFALPRSRLRIWLVAHYFRQIVESMEKRRFDRFLSQIHPDATLRMFDFGEHRGPEGWKEALNDWMDTFPDSTLRLVEYADPGQGDVVLITDNEVEGQGSGARATGITAFLLRIEHGMAMRGRYFAEKSEALEAAGLSE